MPAPNFFYPLIRVLPFIVLSLPLAELVLGIALYRRCGDAFVWWLGAGAFLGVWLLLRAKNAFGVAFQSLSRGDPQSMAASLWILVAGARAFFSGLLLLFPGVLSDLLGLTILLFPGRSAGPAAAWNGSEKSAVIEGEFREVPEESSQLTHEPLQKKKPDT